MARRFATRIGAIRANRFAENPYSHNVRAIRANRLKPAIRAIFTPRSVIREKEVHFSLGTLKRFARIRRFARICESIRANRAI